MTAAAANCVPTSLPAGSERRRGRVGVAVRRRKQRQAAAMALPETGPCERRPRARWPLARRRLAPHRTDLRQRHRSRHQRPRSQAAVGQPAPDRHRITASSRRRPGGGAARVFERRCSMTFVRQRPPVVMGPGLRDDVTPSDLPVGSFCDTPVKYLAQKYFCFFQTQIGL